MLYLPPNVTSQIQPMDAGVINSLQCFYKAKLISHMIEGYDEEVTPDINMKNVVKWVYESWNRVTETTVKNCWKHTNLIPGEEELVELADQSCVSEEIARFHQVLNVPDNEKTPLHAYLNMDNVATEPITLDVDEFIKVANQDTSESSDDTQDTKTLQLVEHDAASKAVLTLIDYIDQQKSGLENINLIKNLYQIRTLIDKNKHSEEQRNRIQLKIDSFRNNK